MPFDNRPADVQAQPQPHARAVLYLDPWRAMKALPDALLLRGRQPWPVIAYQHARLGTLHLKAYLDWLIFRRIFERVRQIIRHHLPDAVSIRQQWRSRRLWQAEHDAAIRPGVPLFFHRVLNNV